MKPKEIIDLDEIEMHRRMEELLEQIAQNNINEEGMNFRMNKGELLKASRRFKIPKRIEKNDEQIHFIDSPQKKYFSIVK